MAFEIGKKYKTVGGVPLTVIAKTPDGQLICETKVGILVRRNADGSFVCNRTHCRTHCSTHDEYNLVDPDEPTPEEREWAVKIAKAAGYHGTTLLILRGDLGAVVKGGSILQERAKRFLALAREICNATR